MATADRVKAKMQGLIDSANAKTGGNDTTLTAAVNALIAGFGSGGGSSGGFEVIEGTITPTTQTQSLRIPWEKDTLPLFYMVVRPDLDVYVTPDNPATGTTLGGIICLTCGYTRVSSSDTKKYIGIKMTATTGYTGYIGGASPLESDILDSNGLLAYINSSAYKWKPDTTYNYYIIYRTVA